MDAMIGGVGFVICGIDEKTDILENLMGQSEECCGSRCEYDLQCDKFKRGLIVQTHLSHPHQIRLGSQIYHASHLPSKLLQKNARKR
jgi:hypothetical protein